MLMWYDYGLFVKQYESTIIIMNPVAIIMDVIISFDIQSLCEDLCIGSRPDAVRFRFSGKVMLPLLVTLLFEVKF